VYFHFANEREVRINTIPRKSVEYIFSVVAQDALMFHAIPLLFAINRYCYLAMMTFSMSVTWC